MTLTASEIAELDRRIAVMQAYRDGKRIECHSARFPLWEVTENPQWDWGVENYRIAPEPRKPREFWISQQHNTFSVWMCEQISITDGNPLPNQIHVREVLPDHLPNSFAGVGLVRSEAKRDAVIIQFIDGDRVVSIECLNKEMLPTLQLEAQRILRE